MKILVTDRAGREHTLEGRNGWRLMEIIRDAGLPIRAECGGCLACATCHVYVGDGWTGSFPPAKDEETSMLDNAFDIQPNSRLSCQLELTPAHDGLKVTLAPDDV